MRRSMEPLSSPRVLIHPELPLKLLYPRGPEQLLLIAVVEALLDERRDTEREDGREAQEGRSEQDGRPRPGEQRQGDEGRDGETDGQHIEGKTITVAATPRWKAGRA